eukprot:TRINITY_DN3678_c0_g1_i1.p1 TRINITY_DN3678_c0_g1~~TRINITY_DN3678_c0_g1_i1.p1  ORF type:complete len:1033 (+),score=246.66 TRINITY_DN3678_c0_g1_i1:239-3337(+)
MSSSSADPPRDIPKDGVHSQVSALVKLGRMGSFVDDCVGALQEVTTPRPLTFREQFASLEELAHVFLVILSRRTRVGMYASDMDLVKEVAKLFEKGNNEANAAGASSESSSPDDDDDGAAQVVVSESLLMSLSSLDNFRAPLVVNRVRTLQLCIKWANRFVKALREHRISTVPDSTGAMSCEARDILCADTLPDALDGTFEDLFAFLTTNLHDQDLDPYCTGNFNKVSSGANDVYVYTGSFGALQVGMPPETIKSFLIKGESVPQNYILPSRLFEYDINFGDVEFPIFFNFFIKEAVNKPEAKVRLIGTADQLDRIKASFQESIFGPIAEHIYMDEDLSDTARAKGYSVDFLREREALAYKDKDGNVPPVESFANFTPWTKGSQQAEFTAIDNESGELVNVRVENNHGIIKVFEDDVLGGVLDVSTMPPPRDKGEVDDSDLLPSIDSIPEEVATFDPPVFGVTFLGTSHGFDPRGFTTGFLIWIDGMGILVDPPVQTTEMLQRSGVLGHYIKKVILTHCHSDHDSGIIRQVLDGERHEIITFKTILESYIRKVNALTGVDVGDYFSYRQVKVGEKTDILGAIFEFDYSFHTVPTMRFRVSFQGKSISYSADTLFDVKTYDRLLGEGVITKARHESLCGFLWDADMIIHEAGVPPIHTPIDNLNALHPDIKKKMCVVHCSCIPETCGSDKSLAVTDLHIPKCGVENTVVLEVSCCAQSYTRAVRRMKLLASVFYFRRLTPSRITELFETTATVKVPAGVTLMKEGEVTNKFYVIESGQVNVFESHGTSNEKLLIKLVRGQFFGESCLINSCEEGAGKPQSLCMASVVTYSSCRLLVVRAERFRELVQREDDLEDDPTTISKVSTAVLRVREHRTYTRDSLGKSFLFSHLRDEQVEAISSIMEVPQYFKAGDSIIQQGDHSTSMYLIRDGSVRLEKTDTVGSYEFLRLEEGGSFGELSLITGIPRTASAVAHTDVTLFELTRERFSRLLRRYQNIRFHVMSVVDRRMRETKLVDKQLKKTLSNPHNLKRSLHES